MSRAKFLLLLTGVIVALSIAFPAEAWVAYRSFHTYGGYGGAAAWGYGGVYHGAYYGRPPAWGYGSGSVTGRYGGSASWSR